MISKKIRNAARGRDCTFRFPNICNFNPETSVWCHINSKFKGVGKKSPDLFGGIGCSSCHDALDGRIEAEINPQWILDAVFESQMVLYQLNIIEVK